MTEAEAYIRVRDEIEELKTHIAELQGVMETKLTGWRDLIDAMSEHVDEDNPVHVVVVGKRAVVVRWIEGCEDCCCDDEIKVSIVDVA